MKNPYAALRLSVVIVFAALTLTSPGQSNECKVLLPEISGSYTGDCKNGLAHGKGTASGIDHYEGQFRKGLPHGIGTYTWTNGPVYRGEWSNGMKDGKGEIIYFTLKGDSITKGIWREGTFVRSDNLPAYTIIRKYNLLSCNLRRINEGNIVIVRFYLKGQVNPRVMELSMVFNNGVQFKSGSSYAGVKDVYFPLNLIIHYVTFNPVSVGAYDVEFECTINEPGRWEITLNN